MGNFTSKTPASLPEYPKHGDERNYRIEDTVIERWEYTAPNGQSVRARGVGRTETVSERYCATCGEWVEARGVFGGMACPKCHRAWFETDEQYARRIEEEKRLGKLEGKGDSDELDDR